MLKASRRNFISIAGKVAALAGLSSLSAPVFAAEKKQFVHHVYFWLKNPESTADEAKLVEGLKKLSKVKTIQEFHIGKPAKTNREVIDRSYSISWLVFFKDKADQDHYQTDPIHLKFVEECAALWSKVLVYDSEDI